jgi:hypothetical protein
MLQEKEWNGNKRNSFGNINNGGYMKKLLIALIFCCSCSVFAQGTPAPATPRLMVDGDGKLLSDTNPAPVKIIGGTGDTASITQSLTQIENAASATTAAIQAEAADYDMLQTSSVSVSNTSADITALANRSWLTLQNTGGNTVYVNIGGTPATTSGYKLLAGGSIGIAKIAASVAVSVVCDTGESSTLVVVQGAK